MFSNFVSTLDGVVSLEAAGHRAGGDISGFDFTDRMVMGLLRAVSDVVMVGTGTLMADPQHVWTPECICPELSADYRALRKTLGLPATPLNVIVSGSGRLDLRLPVFSSGRVRTLILTTSAGARRLSRLALPVGVRVREIHQGRGAIPASTLLKSLGAMRRGARVLVEGGPTLLGDFYALGIVNEQFLTLAPQIAGRMQHGARPSMVMGQQFAPRHPLWGTLVDVRCRGSHLFLRYAFPRGPIKVVRKGLGVPVARRRRSQAGPRG